MEDVEQHVLLERHAKVGLVLHLRLALLHVHQTRHAVTELVKPFQLIIQIADHAELRVHQARSAVAEYVNLFKQIQQIVERVEMFVHQLHVALGDHVHIL